MLKIGTVGWWSHTKLITALMQEHAASWQFSTAIDLVRVAVETPHAAIGVVESYTTISFEGEGLCLQCGPDCPCSNSHGDLLMGRSSVSPVVCAPWECC